VAVPEHDRRDFLRGLGGLAAALASNRARTACAGPAAAPSGARLRIGYQIYGWGRHFPQAWWAGAAAVGELGFRGIEGEYTIAELYEGRESEFEERMVECGVRLAALYSTTDLERSHEAFENTRKNLLAAAFCERAGARVIVIGGTESQRKTPEAFAAYSRAANELGRRLLETHGVRCAVHPHVGSLVESREEIARVMDGTDPRAFFLAPDTGHLAAAGCDPVEIFKSYRDRIVHAHFKDYRRPAAGGRGAFLALGAGEVAFPELVRVLVAAGFDGWLDVELDGRGEDPGQVAAGALRYARERLGLDPRAAADGPARPEA
jgi:inosose dehydratase